MRVWRESEPVPRPRAPGHLAATIGRTPTPMVGAVVETTGAMFGVSPCGYSAGQSGAAKPMRETTSDSSPYACYADQLA